MNYLVRHLIVVGATVALALVATMLGIMWYGSWYNHYAGFDRGVSDGYCNIAVIPLQGDIVPYDGYAYDSYADPALETQTPITTSGDWVETFLDSAVADANIAGVLLQVDSYGGSAAPAAQIRSALARSPIPVVSYIREMGTSAAYMAALGSPTIIASPFAEIGSIGVTYSYVENSESNRQQGLNFVQLSSGKFKDSGNPNKQLTGEERALYERDIRFYKDVFVNMIAESRRMATSTVDALADGSVMPSQLALEHGLIDAVGDDETVREVFAQQLALPVDDIVLCRW
jgi:signal peptide peptidase SppA